MHAATILLRLIHILSAIFWVGTSLFTAFFLFPAVAGAGPAAGPVMAGLQKRGMLTALPAAAGLTILSGLSLIWVTSGGAVGAYMATPVGSTFATAGGIAIVAFVIGMTLARPAAMKAMQLNREMMATPDGPARAPMQARIAALQHRAALATMTVTVMLILAAAGMAIARYR